MYPYLKNYVGSGGTQEQLAIRFSKAVAPGGYVLTSGSETDPFHKELQERLGDPEIFDGYYRLYRRPLETK